MAKRRWSQIIRSPLVAGESAAKLKAVNIRTHHALPSDFKPTADSEPRGSYMGRQCSHVETGICDRCIQASLYMGGTPVRPRHRRRAKK